MFLGFEFYVVFLLIISLLFCDEIKFKILKTKCFCFISLKFFNYICVMSEMANILGITEGFPVKVYKKGAILQREGDKASKSFYIKKGLLRSYTIDNKGKEHNFMFASEGWIISDVESQELNEPALLFIECIEDSEVISLERTTIDTKLFTTEQFDKMMNSLFRRIAVMQRRIILMMSAPAKDRYEYFIKVYPELSNRIPQKMIASYLGITPEALSSIRSKIAKEK